MISRSVYTISAFVLRSLDYGESDRIVTLFTEEFGKLKGIAKGARRSKKRFVNAIELFSYSKIQFSQKSKEGLALIENCDVINHYPGIRSDLDRTLTASYMIELTDHFTVERKKIPHLFCLLENFLGLVEKEQQLEKILRFFELRLLKFSGYEPVLGRCISCNAALDAIPEPYFNPREGGIQCAGCRQNDSFFLPISRGTLKMLHMGKEIETSKIHRLILSEQSLKESKHIISYFIHHILGKKLNSLQILNEINRMGL